MRNTDSMCTPHLERWLSLAEGARLEIVYTVSNGIEGSNPSLSATLLALKADTSRLNCHGG